jgi:hypothetical protein
MGTVLLCSDEPILAEGLARILRDSSALSLVSYCDRVDLLSDELRTHTPIYF